LVVRDGIHGVKPCVCEDH